MQAGREIRVIVAPDHIDDDGAIAALARHRPRDREGARVPGPDQGHRDPRVAGGGLREVTRARATGSSASPRPPAASAPRASATGATRAARPMRRPPARSPASRPVTGRPRSLTTLLRRHRAPRLVPEPPIAPLPGRIVDVPGRGEFFLRDSGGDGPALLLLHGWMVSADLNWITVYDSLRDAGYRVLALDHRGHGRGLRGPAPFRLVDCADDAAAVLRHEGIDRALAVGYSMGGPIACLLAPRPRGSASRASVLVRDGARLAGAVDEARLARSMSLVAPRARPVPERRVAGRASARSGFRDESGTTWAAAELVARERSRHRRGRPRARPGTTAASWLAPPAPAARGHRRRPATRSSRRASSVSSRRCSDVAPRRRSPGTARRGHHASRRRSSPRCLGALSDVRAPATLRGR